MIKMSREISKKKDEQRERPLLMAEVRVARHQVPPLLPTAAASRGRRPPGGLRREEAARPEFWRSSRRGRVGEMPDQAVGTIIDSANRPH